MIGARERAGISFLLLYFQRLGAANAFADALLYMIHQMSNVLTDLKRLAALPDKNPGAWLASAEDGVRFLKEHLRGDQTL